MNAVTIWVIMVYTHGGYWVPTLEFKIEKECRQAAAIVDKAGQVPSRNFSKCIRLTKTL